MNCIIKIFTYLHSDHEILSQRKLIIPILLHNRCSAPRLRGTVRHRQFAFVKLPVLYQHIQFELYDYYICVYSIRNNFEPFFTYVGSQVGNTEQRRRNNRVAALFRANQSCFLTDWGKRISWCWISSLVLLLRGCRRCLVRTEFFWILGGWGRRIGCTGRLFGCTLTLVWCNPKTRILRGWRLGKERRCWNCCSKTKKN